MHLIIAVQRLSLILLCLLFCHVSEAADIPSAAELEQLGLEVRWNSHAVLNVQRDVVTHVSNDESNVYVQSSAGIITAFDAENGRKLWAQQTGRNDEPAMAAVSNKNIVIVVAGPSVLGYNKFTGTLLIDFRLPRQPSASPVMGEGVFYVPVVGGALYAYSTSVLEHKFRYGTLPESVALPHLWRFICNEEIVFAPVNGVEAVAFVTEAGNLHSVNTSGLERGRSRFQLMMKSAATSAPAITDNLTSSSIIMTSGDHRVFSIDLVKGIVEWTYPMGRLMTKQPIVIGEDVFIVGSDGTLTRFSRREQSLDRGRPVDVAQYKAPVFIGAGMEDAANDQQIQDTLQTGPQGVRITTVVSGSPAANAGLRAGDVLFRIGGLPCGSVDIAKELIESQPLRVERNYEVVRVDSGMRMNSVTFDPPLTLADQEPITEAVVVADVLRGSSAALAGIEVGDLLLSVGGESTDSAETAQKVIAAAAPGSATATVFRAKWTARTTSGNSQQYLSGKRNAPAIHVAAGGKSIEAQLTLAVSKDPAAGTAVGISKMKLSIPTKMWDVSGVKSLSAVGRFSIFGIDQTNRLVAFNKKTSDIIGRVPVLGYDMHLHNSVTDQIYLISSTGEVLCLREIGPTVRLPDLSTLSPTAVVKSVNVSVNDPIEATGTVVCEVEYPDGSTHQISADTKGAVKRVYVRVGDEVAIDDPLIQISDDKFATYHQRPQQQPVDVQLQDESAINPVTP